MVNLVHDAVHTSELPTGNATDDRDIILIAADFLLKVYLLVPFFGLFFVVSCHKPEKEVKTSFYHWQTRLQFTQTEKNYLNQLGVQNLYVKFFDVDWDAVSGRAIPVAQLQLEEKDLEGLQIIPTIFITNRTFQHLNEVATDTLAQRIRRKIFQLAEDLDQGQIQEIQIDCDWTASTRALYFRLLEQLKQDLQTQGVLLSVTIRLHQIRYPEQTGVPPVERGMLMCYNTGELEKWEENNSILESQTVAPYLKRLGEYPLSLDLALPIFSWGVLFRDGRMIRLLNDLQADDLTDATRFKRLNDNRYEIVKSTFLRGYYLYQGDRLRLETVSVEELKDNIALLRSDWPTPVFRLAFYHLDTSTIKHYPYEQLDSLRLEFN